MSNWYVATHPNSIFVNGIMIARVDPHCRYGLQNTQFSTYSLSGQTEQRQLASIQELQAVLTDIFRLKLPENSDFSRLF